MRISDNVLDLVFALRTAVQQDGEGNLSSVMAQELSQLPDFEGSQATAGYRVTPEGDIVDDHWWLVMDDDSVFDASDEEPARCSKKDSRHGHYFPYTGETGIPMEVLQMADHLRAASRTANHKSFSEMLGEDGKRTASGVARQAPEALPDGMTMGGQEGMPQGEPDEQDYKPEDMQLGWKDLTDDEDLKEVDHPEYMPGGDETGGYDPTYDERQTHYNPGHPRP